MGCTSGKSQNNQNKQQDEQNKKQKQVEKKVQDNSLEQYEKKDEFNIKLPETKSDQTKNKLSADKRPSHILQVQTPTQHNNIRTIRPKLNSGKEKNTASMDNIRKFYKIGKVLGNGAFGAVRLCTSKFEESRKYAIKTIAKSRMGDKYHMLRRELEILKNLDHPNIIKFYEIYMDEMYIHFVMEYCGGGELYNYSQKIGYFKEDEASKIMNKIVSAVAHMHSRDVIHRDLKPENILFSTNPKNNNNMTDIKIVDFGLSRTFSPQSLSQLPSTVGTPLYVAPEVVNETMYGKECDNWSLGILAYFLLCGKEPFLGKSVTEVFSKIKSGKFNYDDKCFNKVSDEAKDFINKLLVVNPAKRMTSKQALSHPWFKKFRHSHEDLINLDMKETIELKENVQNIMSHQKKFNKLKQEVIKIFVNHHITDLDLEKLKNHFLKLDQNQTGEITFKEMCQVLEQLGLYNIKSDQLKGINEISFYKCQQWRNKRYVDF